MKLIQLPYTIINIEGPDATVFLHNQLCNDIQLLTQTNQAQITGCSSAKGRLIISFWLWKYAPNHYQLIVNPDMALSFAQYLKKFFFRLKVEISLASNLTSLAYIGDIDPSYACNTILLQNIQIITLNYGLNASLLIMPNHLLEEQEWRTKINIIQNEDQWKYFYIQAGIALIERPDLQEKFLPQMLNYDALNILSWTKGCYPGQEIIARAHYLGQVKKRMYILHAEEESIITTDTRLYDESSKEVGCLLHNTPKWGLAVLSYNWPIQQSVYSNGCTLRVQPLPYNLPEAKTRPPKLI